MRIKQIWFQLFYRLHKTKFRDSQDEHFGAPLVFSQGPDKASLSFKRRIGEYEFCFLNLSHTFKSRIDWNWGDHGKLWTYHLNYFEFLNEKCCSKEVGEELIAHYYSARNEINDGMEPYPISLRGVNWIKFFVKHNIHTYDTFLYDQYLLLHRSLEYHLLGNHLLENAISLAFAAIYFDQKEWGVKAIKILQVELDEQILDDGGHFELSPMYHSIILSRLSDLYILLLSNPVQTASFHSILDLLRSTLSAMGSWLSTFKFSNGDIAWINDSSVSMMPAKVNDILDSLKHLDLEYAVGTLYSSGYRRFNNDSCEILIDVGGIGPEYLPGHAHADSLTFVIHWTGIPLIVDTGISTYENNEQRASERSSRAHNCVTINDLNSSDVWSSFRVGRRAKTTIHSESQHRIVASHDGYVTQGIVHQREWKVDDFQVTINDQLIGDHSMKVATLHLHFHPDLQIRSIENRILADDIEFIFSSNAQMEICLTDYQYAMGFNKRRTGTKAEISFSGYISTKIHKPDTYRDSCQG